MMNTALQSMLNAKLNQQRFLDLPWEQAFQGNSPQLVCEFKTLSFQCGVGLTWLSLNPQKRESIIKTKDSFNTQDRNEKIKSVKVEATFSRGHVSLI